MILYRITFLLFALLLSSTSLYSQTRIGKKDQQKIQKTCETYQRQERLLITDFEASADSIKNITSEFVFDQMIMIREFYERMQYDLIFDDEETIDLDLGDSLGCIVKSFDRIFKLNVRKEEGNWVIYGFDNHEVNQ